MSDHVLLLESSDQRPHTAHQHFFAGLDELLERSGFRWELLGVGNGRQVLTVHEDGGDPDALATLIQEIRALGQRMLVAVNSSDT